MKSTNRTNGSLAHGRQDDARYVLSRDARHEFRRHTVREALSQSCRIDEGKEKFDGKEPQSAKQQFGAISNRVPRHHAPVSRDENRPEQKQSVRPSCHCKAVSTTLIQHMLASRVFVCRSRRATPEAPPESCNAHCEYLWIVCEILYAWYTFENPKNEPGIGRAGRAGRDGTGKLKKYRFQLGASFCSDLTIQPLRCTIRQQPDFRL